VGPGRVVRARDIAEQHDIPLELLAKILQKLARAGMLESAPGPTGGYVLARSADSISVGAVVQAVEGETGLTQCMKPDERICEQHLKCTIRTPLERVNARVQNLLNHISLTEINGGDVMPSVDGHLIRVSEVGATPPTPAGFVTD
jgi:Rrf2 family protein